jgi:hypothetical protein
LIEGVALVKNPGTVRLDFKEFTYELHHALSSDDFSKQTTKEGDSKESNLGVGSLRILFKRSWLNGWEISEINSATEGEDGKDGKVEEEIRNAISPPAWCALQLVAAGKAGEDDDYTYLEPGERSRYSFVASLPADTAIVFLQCDFYDKNDHVESVKKMYAVPATPTNMPKE